MFEEHRWGEYKVIDIAEFSGSYKSLTKQLTEIKSSKGISYQVHRHRNEVWTFIDGEGNWYSMISGRLSTEAIWLRSRKDLNMQSGLSPT